MTGGHPARIHVVGAAIIDGTRCLAARRGEGMDLAGLWELPGGKVEPGETPEVALARELREELAIECSIGGFVGRGESRTSERHVVLDVYEARLVSGAIQPREHSAIRWLEPPELFGVEWAEADLPIIAVLQRRLSA